MSKKMTPCEKLGYKAGDKFEVIEDSVYFKKGEIVSLIAADNSSCPFFINEKVVRDGYSKGCAMYLSDVKKISKLKPAKQALADAIHQNGGWVDGAAAAIFGKKTMTCAFLMDWALPVSYNPERGSWSVISSGVISGFKMNPFVNWHQTILSRDEYFTAYPDQAKVEVNNETEHKAEAEVKSESEMTIMASDWHKNGELPHVGEVCEAFVYEDDSWSEVEIIAHKDGIAIGWSSIDELTYQSRNEKSFRPLRTERDKAIDEIISTAKKIGWNSEMASQIIGEVAAELYDAGYRKEVK